MAGYNAKHAGAPDFTPLQPRDLCARTDSFLVVPADAPVAKTFKNGDDIWIVALETALEENNEVAAVQENANRIQASQQSRKDKSYYYWAQVWGGGACVLLCMVRLAAGQTGQVVLLLGTGLWLLMPFPLHQP